ncbi:MAG: DUF2911 domain-containing protein [Phycisphaerae bacterium]|nr:DUF2911 domain-containing protein [Gemmatimonadaceae bacterium]
MRLITAGSALAACVLSVTQLSAQSASIVYRLGADTVAIEQFTRTTTRLTGEMVQRSGAAVVRVNYDMTLGSDGRATAATVTRLNGDGTAVPNSASSTRFRFTADSAIRENVFADSVQRRAFPIGKAWVNFPTFVYGPTELLAAIRKSGTKVDSLPALGLTGNPGVTGLQPAGGDTLRLRGGAYAMLLRYDANSRLQLIDGTFTTNKAIGTRGTKTFDIAAVARGMKPTGVLSVRDVARASFGAGGMVLIDYGRPMVRERTVWGGTLVPFDSVWRAGANDAAHLFTTRTLALGSVTLAPGMYTLWVQHTRAGTFLIVNKQTGQWGTQYDAAQDVGRVQMQMAAAPSHVEEFTFAVKALAGNRGAIEMSWGSSLFSVPFATSVASAR